LYISDSINQNVVKFFDFSNLNQPSKRFYTVYNTTTIFVVHNKQKLVKIGVFVVHCKTMNTCPIELNSTLIIVYYNKGKSNMFRINVDVTMHDAKNPS